MARNGLDAHLEIAGNLSSMVDLILEYLEDQCLNKKHNEDSEKRQEILAVETKPACQPIVEAIRKLVAMNLDRLQPMSCRWLGLLETNFLN